MNKEKGRSIYPKLAKGRFHAYVHGNDLSLCVYICGFVHMSVIPTEARRGVKSPETGVIGSC